ncbi:MAG: PLDc N-terminal domain-containing protein [Acidimicrobiia bacterium]|nr:PLDc N-terminal domain-containing protein [Acidimicrobiia bacterium]
MIASYNGDIGAWFTFWVVVHVVLQVIALADLARKRNVTKRSLTAKWVILVVVVPVLGFLGYYFHLMEQAIERNTSGRGYQEDVAPFLQSFKLTE